MKRTSNRLSWLGAAAIVTLGMLGGCSEHYHIGHRAAWYGGNCGSYLHTYKYKRRYGYGHFGYHHHHRPHYGHGHGHHHGSHCY